jgi:hypothetical protein
MKFVIFTNTDIKVHAITIVFTSTYNIKQNKS